MPEKEDIFEMLFENQENMTEKQKKILEAAVEIFSEKGYSGTSTSEIAKKAGVAEGTIFRHYKTKKDLLLSIIAPTMAKFMAPLFIRDFNKVLLSEHQSLEDFLRAVIINRMEYAKKHLPSIKILIQEIPFHAELRGQFKEHVMNKVYERLKVIVDAYQKKGEMIQLPPPSAIRLIASSILGFVIGRYLMFPEADWDDELEVERTIQFILHGLSVKKEEC
ncbi:TetR family transcriptional regulator [Bacillus obstructivus]|uniref:TetR/AcrR family transcriptional regulator n=1 Tax=Heyndrickxia oleronia TaxID=38875 RepID=UPI0009032382|nr:TetR family transcriptional regulator [Bacillus obstructivus]